MRNERGRRKLEVTIRGQTNGRQHCCYRTYLPLSWGLLQLDGMLLQCMVSLIPSELGQIFSVVLERLTAAADD